MAKSVGYFQDNGEEMYSEGPYVLTRAPFGQGYRVEKRGAISPILPPLWVSYLRTLWGIPEGWQPEEVLAPLVDALNKVHHVTRFYRMTDKNFNFARIYGADPKFAMVSGLPEVK